ncbi:hypothetical protein JS530_08100 [Bifidobacterium sp. LC6]|uniref:Uncharacterized protein n=1 Tax=Bifidobacterium colobi TaxID=2809026 RepID=A0ABS5UWH7_9BIFI|nr:hypothetical protein [Bifidobacterium colobi]MBT1175455.1 hypothetical protein [Bifidobacterium colobi]
MRIPKISTLYMITAALNAVSAILECVQAKPNPSRVMMRISLTLSWAIITALQLQNEQEAEITE